MAGVSPRPYNDDLVCYVHGLLSATIVPRPYLRWSPRFRRASAQVDKLYHEVIECHSGTMRERHGAEPDLIDDLLDLHESDPKFFPEADLKIAAMGPFVAALDTVAGTCAFMLYALLRHPDVLAKVREEADALLSGDVPPEQALREMDAMHRAAMETMRMYPVTPLLVRTAANSFEFAGHRIPAGERVMIATAVPHYLPEFFPEPERFDIDRYTPERAEHKQPYVYAPFGLGPHRCLGNGFAEVQIATTMATVLHEVDLDLDRAGYSLKTTQVPLPAPDESFKVRVRGQARGRAAARGTEAVGRARGGARRRALGCARRRGRERGIPLDDAGATRPAPAYPMKRRSGRPAASPRRALRTGAAAPRDRTRLRGRRPDSRPRARRAENRGGDRGRIARGVFGGGPEPLHAVRRIGQHRAAREPARAEIHHAPHGVHRLAPQQDRRMGLLHRLGPRPAWLEGGELALVSSPRPRPRSPAWP